MKFIKATIFSVIIMFTVISCGGNRGNSTFPNIKDADIPDILEKTVGTLGDTYFSSEITDSKDYRSFFTATFKNTTEAEYAELMEHYRSGSTGTNENDFLLFDWGRLLVTSEDNSISICAYIK